MEHLTEFVINQLFLCVAFAVVLIMTIRAEVIHQSNKTTELSPMQATRLMNNEKAIVVDVSSADQFEQGHINNAINMPINDLKKNISELEQYKDRVVLAYCASGNQSQRACKILKQSSFDNVHNITGGLKNWLDANLPIKKTKT